MHLISFKKINIKVVFLHMRGHNNDTIICAHYKMANEIVDGLAAHTHGRVNMFVTTDLSAPYVCFSVSLISNVCKGADKSMLP